VRRGTWLFAAAAVAVLGVGMELASRGGESAERRVRRYFAVRGALDTVSLREAVLRAVTLGSPESRLAWFADSARLGADGTSSYDPPGSDGKAFIRFDSDPPPLDPITETYMVFLDFDASRKLRGVHVHRAFTGP